MKNELNLDELEEEVKEGNTIFNGMVLRLIERIRELEYDLKMHKQELSKARDGHYAGLDGHGPGYD